MGEDRSSTGNPNHGTEEYSQDIRHDRAVLRQVPLSLSRSLQCRNVRCISRKNYTMLLPAESIFDSGQRIVSQRSGCMEMVFRSPQISCRLQSSRIFPGTQCAGKNMASYTSSRYAQSLFFNSERTALDSNFNIPKYSEKTFPGARIFASVSIIFM
jgi:hypothetical protein